MHAFAARTIGKNTSLQRWNTRLINKLPAALAGPGSVRNAEGETWSLDRRNAGVLWGQFGHVSSPWRLGKLSSGKGPHFACLGTRLRKIPTRAGLRNGPLEMRGTAKK